MFDQRSAGLQILAVVAVNRLAGALAGPLLGPSQQLLRVFRTFLTVAATRSLESFTFTGSLLMTIHAQFYVESVLWGY